MITACGDLFDIDSNAAGMTAEERAVKVQSNLDNALIAALNRTPAAVQVQYKNNNPIVTLDNYMIVTADGNSASRSNMTQLQLAEKWAKSIRMCLANTGEMDKYLAMLTGKFPAKKIASATMLRDEIAVAPAEMLFPIELVTPISTDTANVGDRIEAVISHDVPLLPSYSTYLPAGTLVIGSIEDALPYVPNHYAGKDAFTVNFFESRTPDGKRVPIDGHVYGSINSARRVSIKPLFAECCGNGATRQDNLALVRVHVTPAKGNIVGSWKGTAIEGPLGDTKSLRQLKGLGLDGHTTAQGLELGMPRLTFNRHLGPMVLPAGQPMLLQLSATTTIALSGGKTL